MAGQAVTAHGAARFSWAPTRRPVLLDYEYAEFPLRAAAFVLDLVLAAVVAFVAATVIGWLVRQVGEADSFVMLTLLGLAIVAVLPTALAVWLWRRFGATPVQARFGLEVTHWRTGEPLSRGAAFARWVLLYAPLTLLVAYPQIVTTAFDRSPFLVLVDVPWLPFATMTLPLLWYVALAYPAIVDRRRVRGLHDRICGSVVVRAVGDWTPRDDRAADGRGETTIAELVPFVWFTRTRLPALGWLFVAAALVVALVGVAEIAGSPPEGVGWLVAVASRLTQVMVVLLPAALLWRVPDAAQRHVLLLIGLAIAAVLVTAATLAELAGRVEPGLATLIGPQPWTWVELLAPPLVGFGLLGMRRLGPTRPRLLLALATVFLGLQVAELALRAGDAFVALPSINVFAFGAPALYWLGAAFAMWVPLSAWLDGEQPRRFWGLLALALPLHALYWLAVLGVALARTPEGMAAVQPLVSIVATLALAAIALISLVAYGRFAPRD